VIDDRFSETGPAIRAGPSGKAVCLSDFPDKAVRIIPLFGNIYGEIVFKNKGTFANGNRNNPQYIPVASSGESVNPTTFVEKWKAYFNESHQAYRVSICTVCRNGYGRVRKGVEIYKLTFDDKTNEFTVMDRKTKAVIAKTTGRTEKRQTSTAGMDVKIIDEGTNHVLTSVAFPGDSNSIQLTSVSASVTSN
jgi:hypothetical protein